VKATTVVNLGCAALAALALALGAPDALAQQKHKCFFKAPPGVTKFVQTHLLDVGDVPGHQMRMVEVQTKFQDVSPDFDGVKVREIRGVLVSDYIAGTGDAVLHSVRTLENGDKVLA
jgi:hypothetical protein